LFLAAEPTWESWLTALERNWVVAVRHDAVTRHRTRILGGAPGVAQVVRAHEASWRWWGERPEALSRPLCALVAVKPGDEFEVGRPARGVALRLRLWWIARQGRPKERQAELVRLTVDGQPVSPKLVEPKDNQALTDSYHLAELPDLAPGRHQAVATVRRLGSQTEVTEAITFDA
jgi:hypothetical protein